MYNFHPETLNWIASYLEARSHYVSISTKTSTYRNVLHGVPQGSVLIPILYVIFMNELPAVVTDENCNNVVHDYTGKLFDDNCNSCGSVPTFTDDSTYVISTSTRYKTQEKISMNIRKIKNFMDANVLSINLGKMEIVECMVRQKRVRITGNEPQITVMKPDSTLKTITATDYCHLLGANISREVNWKSHIETGEKSVLASLRSVIGAIAHIAPNLPVKSRLLLSNGLVISSVLYLIVMWGGLPQNLSRKIQSLLNRCVRVITGLSRKTRTRTLMERCGWMYLSELVSCHSLLALWKLLRMRMPSY